MKFYKGGDYVLYKEIDSYLKEHGITRSFIADKTGLSNSTLTAIFSGKRKLLATEYATICRVLNVSLDSFSDTQNRQETA